VVPALGEQAAEVAAEDRLVPVPVRQLGGGVNGLAEARLGFVPLAQLLQALREVVQGDERLRVCLADQRRAALVDPGLKDARQGLF
jgi:hypothetical protein